MAALSLVGCASSPPTTVLDDSTPIELPPAPDGSPVAIHGRLQVAGTSLVDQSGQRVQLKGVSSMWLAGESGPYAESESALKYMRDNWKLSVIRAAMGGSGTDTPVSSPQSPLLPRVEQIVQNAIRLGVYVIVDWHTEQAVSQQADAITFFTAMAHKYGAYPNLIWEPYNEPGKGVTWAQIKPYHEALVDAIRPIDPNNLIVMGTPNWSQYVDTAAANPVAPASGTANLLYTVHFYACDHTQWLRDRADTAIAAGVAIFITEFGATPANGGQGSTNYVCRDEANLWFDWMAANNVSGAAWKLDKCSDTSCILANGASASGPWPDDVLTTDANNTLVSTGKTQGGGHGTLVVDWIRE